MIESPKVINAGSGGLILFEENTSQRDLQDQTATRGGAEHCRIWNEDVDTLIDTLQKDWKKISEWGLFFIVKSVSWEDFLDRLHQSFKYDPAGGGVVRNWTGHCGKC